MIAARLWKEKADIIHVHNYEAPFAAYLCRRKHRIPIVYTAHNLMAEELQTYFSNPILRTAGRVFGSWLDQNIPRRADAAVSIREQTAEHLSKLGCKPVFTILPAVEELVVDVEKRTIPTVIYAGNLDNYQDLEIFVRLAQNLSEIQFRIVTSSRPEGGVLDSSIDVIHTQDFQEVCRELAQAHLCIVPRKICSGFPMKILNALALGVPVIAFCSAVPPMEGVIRVASYNEMEAQIKSLVHNSAQCEALGRQGKKIVLSEYAWEKRAIEFEKIYNYLINEKNRRKS